MKISLKLYLQDGDLGAGVQVKPQKIKLDLRAGTVKLNVVSTLLQ